MKLLILDADLTATTVTLTALTEASLSDMDAKLISGTDKIVRYSAMAGSGDYTPDDQTGGTGFWIFHAAPLLELQDDSYDHAANSKTNVSSNLILFRDYVRNLCVTHIQYKYLVTQQLTTKLWTNCTADEKDFLVTLGAKEDGMARAADETNKIAFIKSHLSLATDALAKLELAHRWGFSHEEIALSYSEIIHSHKLHDVIAQYLTYSDRADFIQNLIPVFALLKEGFISNEEDGIDGFVDLVNSTNSYSGVGNLGLADLGYFLDSGNLTDFKADLLLLVEQGDIS